MVRYEAFWLQCWRNAHLKERLYRANNEGLRDQILTLCKISNSLFQTSFFVEELPERLFWSVCKQRGFRSAFSGLCHTPSSMLCHSTPRQLQNTKNTTIFENSTCGGYNKNVRIIGSSRLWILPPLNKTTRFCLPQGPVWSQFVAGAKQNQTKLQNFKIWDFA